MNDTVLEAARRAFERGNLAEAGQLYGRVLQSAPQDFESVSRIGLIQLASGDFKSAEATLAAAIAIAGQSAELHFHQSRALQSRERLPEPIGSFARAATIKPAYMQTL